MRKYLIGVFAGLVSTMAFASVASADVTALRIEATATPSKQDANVRGPLSNVYFESNDTHAGALPCPLGTANSLTCYAFPPSIQARVVFPTDVQVRSGQPPGLQPGVAGRQVEPQAPGPPAPGRSSDRERTSSSSPMAGG